MRKINKAFWCKNRLQMYKWHKYAEFYSGAASSRSQTELTNYINRIDKTEYKMICVYIFRMVLIVMYSQVSGNLRSPMWSMKFCVVLKCPFNCLMV